MLNEAVEKTVSEVPAHRVSGSHLVFCIAEAT